MVFALRHLTDMEICGLVKRAAEPWAHAAPTIIRGRHPQVSAFERGPLSGLRLLRVAPVAHPVALYLHGDVAYPVRAHRRNRVLENVLVTRWLVNDRMSAHRDHP